MSRRGHNFRKGNTMFRKGFTLIEMLVVIAIIGILASMLAGPLMRARTNALKSACINNLKQMGTTLILYETNYNVAPTGAGVTNDRSSALPIAAMFKANLLDNTKLVYCPVGTVTLIADDDANSMAKAATVATPWTAATVPVTGPITGTVTTTYLFTWEYTRGSPGNRVVAGDASAATGYSPNHGDSGTAWTEGANALSKDGSVKGTTTGANGYYVEGSKRGGNVTTTPYTQWGAGDLHADKDGTQIGKYN